jgi:hypothetical protein
MQMIDDITARIANLAAGKSPKEDVEPVSTLLAKFVAMKAEMCAHFKEEIDVGLLLVRKGMTCKQVSREGNHCSQGTAHAQQHWT